MSEPQDKLGTEYNSRFRSMCRTLFVEQRSLAGVDRELRRRGYKQPPNFKTLTKWRNEEGWNDDLRKRDEIQGAETVSGDDLEKLIFECKAMRKIARQRIMIVDPKSGELTIKAADPQDFYAYNRMVETEAKLIEIQRRVKRESEVSTPLDVIFKTLKRHPKLAKLLADPKIIAELKDLARDEIQQALLGEVTLG